MSNENPFQSVAKKAGGVNAIARLLGRTPSTVSYWSSKSGIPPKAAIELEKATNGEIPRWMSRPDLWERPKKGAAQ